MRPASAAPSIPKPAAALSQNGSALMESASWPASQPVPGAKTGLANVRLEEVQVAGVGHEDELLGRHAHFDQGGAGALAEDDHATCLAIEQPFQALGEGDQRTTAQGTEGDRYGRPEVPDLEDERHALEA